MKHFLSMIAFGFLTIACAQKENKTGNFGAVITKENAISKEDMLAKYQAMKVGDTLSVKVETSINSVCQKKGCWMRLDLGASNEAFVKFKDYAFFVPLDSQNKKAIVSGKAYVSMESVEDLQHYAKDAGKTEEEIKEITEPKATYSFMSDGVLILK
jgi:hypothetical protein